MGGCSHAQCRACREGLSILMSLHNLSSPPRIQTGADGALGWQGGLPLAESLQRTKDFEATSDSKANRK